jgi:hypothetical protein
VYPPINASNKSHPLVRHIALTNTPCYTPLTSFHVNIPDLSKILKCADNTDVITLKAEEGGDTLSMMFESKDADRISDFTLKVSFAITSERKRRYDKTIKPQMW